VLLTERQGRIMNTTLRASQQDGAAVTALEKRVKELEVELKQIKELNGIPGQTGPRGPAGDIVAAVNAATAASKQAVLDAEQRIQNVADQAYAKFTADVAELRKDLNDRIIAAVDNATIQVLRDYHLLNANLEPTHWSFVRT
jgi:hypothetical protein